MKKFLTVLLSAGLLLAFSISASAVGGADVKVSGQYLINGMYASNPSLQKTTDKGSYGVYDQRLRMQMDFKVAEGLMLVTRFDALEKVWGAKTSNNESFDSTSRQYTTSNYQQENIEFERAYVDFTTGIGRFMVGYQQFTYWGTPIADGNNTKPGIKYIVASGPSILVLAFERNQEGQVRNGVKTYDYLDSDTDIYDVGYIYKWSGGEAGIMYQYAQINYNRPTPPAGSSNKGTLHVFDPYVKQTMGPLYVESEMIFLTGKAAEFENPLKALGYRDVDANDFGVYLKANYDLKPAYAGFIFLYVQGDDYGSATKQNGGWIKTLNAATNVFEPCLIFGSYWYNHAVGGQTGFANTGTTTVNNYTYFFDNLWMVQGYVGTKPTPKLDVTLSYTWLKADQKPRAIKGSPVSTGNPEFISDSLGTELDLKATYKIFDNLAYTVGAAYFWTGDYFKGTSTANQVDDNYLLMHSLNLTF